MIYSIALELGCREFSLIFQVNKSLKIEYHIYDIQSSAD